MTKRKEVKGKPGPPSNWTDERNETLRRMAGQGYSGSQIATELHCTRSAIMGRAARMGVKLISNAGSVGRVFAPGGKEPKRRERTLRARPVSVAKRPEPALARYVPEPAPVAIVPAPVAEPVLAGEPVTLDQLTRQSCRYIAGDPLKDAAPFCGAPRRAGSAYCAAHHALCYVAPPGIKETRLRPGMARAGA
jgi:GcrA cell cycle regulator